MTFKIYYVCIGREQSKCLDLCPIHACHLHNIEKNRNIKFTSKGTVSPLATFTFSIKILGTCIM